MFPCRNTTSSPVLVPAGAITNGWLGGRPENAVRKILADAAECDLVGSLAADKEKREMFRGLAEQYRRMAEALKQEIDRRAAA
jgi:hypothetical protein